MNFSIHKFGDTREDGYRFVHCTKGVENWASPEAWERRKNRFDEWVKDNPEKNRERKRKWRIANAERVRLQKRQAYRRPGAKEKVADWKRKNRSKVKEHKRRAYLKNREAIRARAKLYRQRNAANVSAAKSEYKARNRDKINAHSRVVYSRDPHVAMISRIRRRVNMVLSRGRAGKPCSTYELLGCSALDLVKHIESQFLPGMGWHNRREWHIDHKIPFCKIDIFDPQQLRMVCHYTNLRPLWSLDNLTRKYDDIEIPQLN